MRIVVITIKEIMRNPYFFNMIKTLREKEEVMLYENILSRSEEEKKMLLNFLTAEYQKEATHYPFIAPDFHADAALWAAETVYIAAQLMLYRQHSIGELEELFPTAEFSVNASTMLSVDLCFRFVPDMLRQLKLIDQEDWLIVVLEKRLSQWHYSGIHYELPIENLDFDVVFADDCLQQLYLDRIVKYKNTRLSNQTRFNALIRSNFGLFKDNYWKDFKTQNHE